MSEYRSSMTLTVIGCRAVISPKAPSKRKKNKCPIL